MELGVFPISLASVSLAVKDITPESVTPSRRSAQALTPCIHFEVTDSGCIKKAPPEVHCETQLEGNDTPN
ncbi:MAG: hypothetical protein P8X89_17060 [Reinekea sp.]